MKLAFRVAFGRGGGGLRQIPRGGVIFFWSGGCCDSCTRFAICILRPVCTRFLNPSFSFWEYVVVLFGILRNTGWGPVSCRFAIWNMNVSFFFAVMDCGFDLSLHCNSAFRR